MHILIIPSEEFLPPQDHMAGIFQLHQALALRKAGHEVRVLSIRQALSAPMLFKGMFFSLLKRPLHPDLRGKNFIGHCRLLIDKMFHPGKSISVESVEGLHVLRITGFYYFPPGKHTNHLGWLQAGWTLWNYYVSQYGKPDIIHAHNAVYAGMLGARICRLTGVPYVITEHSSFVARKLESGLIQRRIQNAYSHASAVLPVSDFLASKLKEIYGGNTFRYQVIPNVLDPFVEQASWQPASQPSGVFRFLSVASLIPLKRHSDLIEAFGRMYGGKLDVHLHIGGGGDLKSQLVNQVEHLGLVGQVTFLGKLDREAVLKAIDECDCLVLTSEIETFGVVLIEALARGKPVIASRCGGPETVVHQGNGFLYDVGDVDALAKAMKQVKDEIRTFVPEKLRLEALARYGSVPFAKELVEIYGESQNKLWKRNTGAAA